MNTLERIFQRCTLHPSLLTYLLTSLNIVTSKLLIIRVTVVHSKRTYTNSSKHMSTEFVTDNMTRHIVLYILCYFCNSKYYAMKAYRRCGDRAVRIIN